MVPMYAREDILRINTLLLGRIMQYTSMSPEKKSSHSRKDTSALAYSGFVEHYYCAAVIR